MKNLSTAATIGLMTLCIAFSLYARGQKENPDGGMQATVEKVQVALERTAAQQFKGGHDSAGAETCMQLYDLDNEANIWWIVKAGDALLRVGQYERAKNAFVKYLEKKNSVQVMARLATAEYGLRNYARALEILKQIPGLVESQEQITMIAVESYFATGAYDEVLLLLPERRVYMNKRGLELAALSCEKMSDFKKALLYNEKLLGVTPVSKRMDIGYRIAALYEKMGQKPRAMKAFEKNIAEYPSDIRNYEHLSWLYMSNSQWRQAQTLLEKAIQAPGSSPVIQCMLARCFAAQANRIAAVTTYRQYLAKVPRDSAAWYELGSVYYEQEHYAEAIEALKKSAAMMPKNTECLTLLGECSIRTGDVRSAVASFEQSRTIVKNDIRVLSQLAACYRLLHDAKNLMSVVRDWAAFDPKNGRAQYELAEMYMENQRWHEALLAIENACAIDSTRVDVQLLNARACEKNGNESGRLSHLKTAFRYAADNPDVLYELGAYYAGKNQAAAARPLFVKALSIDRMHGGAHFEYAKLLESSGDKDSAYEHFSTAVQIDPFNTTFLVQFARCAFAVGKRDVAFDYLKKAVSRDSTQPEVLQWAGIMYKEAGSADTARVLLLKALVRGSKCASCYKYLADIYFDNGEYDLAVKFYTESLSAGNYSEAASVALGNALILSGDFARARTMYDRIFSENPKSEEALYRLCSAYLRLRMLDKAKDLFAQHSSGRTGGWIHLARGEIAEAEGRADDALISFTVASNLMPENPLAFAGVGRINLMKRDYNKAVESFGRALGNAPHNVDFLLGMGQAYEGIEQLSSAFELYAEVARKAPRQPDVFGRMGWVLSRQQLHDQAVAAFRRGLELNPKNGALAYGLGNEFRIMMQFAESIDAFKKSVRNRNDEKRFFEAYKNIGDIYFYDLKNPEKAKDFYKKYMKFGGRDETVVSLVNTLR
jgi:tetratricopeptide (TPR) repeat protein